jgi:hypothetical protein
VAENEILDIGGRRWRRLRAALADPSRSMEQVAVSMRRDLELATRHLAKGLMSGDVLCDLLRAFEGSRERATATVAAFKNHRLAQIIWSTIEREGTKDVSRIASRALDSLGNAISDKIECYAAKSGASAQERAELRSALSRDFAEMRGGLQKVLECSLRNEPVEAPRMPRRALRRLSPAELARQSLLPAEARRVL